MCIWIDVRDIALGHVKAMETPAAGGKRFFFTTGFFSNSQLAGVVRSNFPQYKDEVPDASVPGGKLPDAMYKVDNSQTVNVLGMKFRPFDQCIIDLVKSLQTVGGA